MTRADRRQQPGSSGWASPSSASGWRSSARWHPKPVRPGARRLRHRRRGPGRRDGVRPRRGVLRSARGMDRDDRLDRDERAGRQRPLAQRPVDRRDPLRGAVVRRHGQRQVLPVHGHPPGPVRAAAAGARVPSDRPMALEIDIEECLGCGACESACPQGAITQGSEFPVAYEVDPLLCNDCRKCLVVCPVDGLVADKTGPCATDAVPAVVEPLCRRPSAAKARSCAPRAARCSGGSKVVSGRAGGCRGAADGSRMASCPKVKKNAATHSRVIRRHPPVTPSGWYG